MLENSLQDEPEILKTIIPVEAMKPRQILPSRDSYSVRITPIQNNCLILRAMRQERGPVGQARLGRLKDDFLVSIT